MWRVINFLYFILPPLIMKLQSFRQQRGILFEQLAAWSSAHQEKKKRQDKAKIPLRG